MLPMSKSINFLKSVPTEKESSEKSYKKQQQRNTNYSKAMAKTREVNKKDNVSFFVRYYMVEETLGIHN